jgi:hypothetical protein
MTVNSVLRCLFEEEILARVIIEQWKERSSAMHETLLEMYVVMYRVVFETKVCFAVMSNSVMTHEFNGFEIDFKIMSGVQKTALLELLQPMNYHISNCPFVNNVSMTGFPREPNDGTWCNTRKFFATFVDNELSTARDYEEAVLRADTLSVVLQDMLVSSTRIAPAHAQFLQILIEAIHKTELPTKEGGVLVGLHF